MTAAPAQRARVTAASILAAAAWLFDHDLRLRRLVRGLDVVVDIRLLGDRVRLSLTGPGVSHGIVGAHPTAIGSELRRKG